MKRLLLLPLLAFAVSAASASIPKTIIIDAGHGGHDRGGIPGQKACEKTLALDVAHRLNEIMKQGGVKTVMTRRDDQFISLARRAAIANAHPGALFVSIHFNSGLRRSANGFETYFYNAKAAPIATKIYSELYKIHPGEKRGVKKRAYYVLRKTRNPAVLIECGFLTNPQEAARCQTPAYREKLAQAIAKGINGNLGKHQPPRQASAQMRSQQ